MLINSKKKNRKFLMKQNILKEELENKIKEINDLHQSLEEAEKEVDKLEKLKESFKDIEKMLTDANKHLKINVDKLDNTDNALKNDNLETSATNLALEKTFSDLDIREKGFAADLGKLNKLYGMNCQSNAKIRK